MWNQHASPLTTCPCFFLRVFRMQVPVVYESSIFLLWNAAQPFWGSKMAFCFTFAILQPSPPLYHCLWQLECWHFSIYLLNASSFPTWQILSYFLPAIEAHALIYYRMCSLLFRFLGGLVQSHGILGYCRYGIWILGLFLFHRRGPEDLKRERRLLLVCELTPVYQNFLSVPWGRWKI